MIIEDKKVVALSYVLTVEGEEVEATSPDSPLQFIFGTGFLLKSFEDQIVGKKVGDKFDFTLTPTQAYGEAMDDAIVELNKDMFLVDGEIEEGLLEVGSIIPMRDNQGNHLNGVVTEINGDKVMMDFNHPLAGDTLHFSGKVLGVREATEQDYQRFMPQAGGCGCGCGDNGCGDEGCGEESCDSEQSCGCGGHKH